MFETIRSSGLLAKMVTIEGDLGLPKLGLCTKDQETIIKNVSIVFHSAATINLDLGESGVILDGGYFGQWTFGHVPLVAVSSFFYQM